MHDLDMLRSIRGIGAIMIAYVAVRPFGAFRDVRAESWKDKTLGRIHNVAGPNGAGFVEATDATLAFYVGNIILAALSLVGIIFLVQMVYAGVKWMTARGESEPIETAKHTIQRSIIGLIIVLGAWAITAFIFNALPGVAPPASR